MSGKYAELLGSTVDERPSQVRGVNLGCADAFILLLDTCGYLGRPLWIKKLKEYQVPVVCLIERINEEQCIEEYKQDTKNSLLRQARTQTKLEASKEAENNSVQKLSRNLYYYTSSWPVKDYNSIVEKIKTSFGEDTPIFSFDSTCLHRLENEGELKKDFSSVKELFDKTVQELVRVQKERGMNQKVFENKQKNKKIETKSLRWAFLEPNEEEEKVKEVPQEKPKENADQPRILTWFAKYFGFGSNSKTVKA